MTQRADRRTGTFSATVDMERPAYLLLKQSFDPRWTVEIDGAEADAVLIAPSLVGVAVADGPHTVTFRYESYPDYPLLLGIGFLTLVALAGVPRLRTRRERVRSESAEPSAT